MAAFGRRTSLAHRHGLPLEHHAEHRSHEGQVPDVLHGRRCNSHAMVAEATAFPSLVMATLLCSFCCSCWLVDLVRAASASDGGAGVGSELGGVERWGQGEENMRGQKGPRSKLGVGAHILDTPRRERAAHLFEDEAACRQLLVRLDVPRFGPRRAA